MFKKVVKKDKQMVGMMQKDVGIGRDGKDCTSLSKQNQAKGKIYYIAQKKGVSSEKRGLIR